MLKQKIEESPTTDKIGSNRTVNEYCGLGMNKLWIDIIKRINTQ